MTVIRELIGIGNTIQTFAGPHPEPVNEQQMQKSKWHGRRYHTSCLNCFFREADKTFRLRMTSYWWLIWTKKSPPTRTCCWVQRAKGWWRIIPPVRDFCYPYGKILTFDLRLPPALDQFIHRSCSDDSCIGGNWYTLRMPRICVSMGLSEKSHDQHIYEYGER